jgi:hypothetical protein
MRVALTDALGSGYGVVDAASSRAGWGTHARQMLSRLVTEVAATARCAARTHARSMTAPRRRRRWRAPAFVRRMTASPGLDAAIPARAPATSACDADSRDTRAVLTRASRLGAQYSSRALPAAIRWG